MASDSVLGNALLVNVRLRAEIGNDGRRVNRAIIVACEHPGNVQMGILEKIADIEREIARTQKNKGKLLL